MKPFNYYETHKIPYPNKRDYTTFFAYDRGKCLETRPNFYTSKGQIEGDYPDAVIQEVLDEDAYKAHSKEYRDECTKLHEEFQNDLFEDYGVSDNPKGSSVLHLLGNAGILPVIARSITSLVIL